MRITGGQYCNREIQVPKTDLIRPTQDRVRQAVFNIIQTEVAGCDFLDLFAGSGAAGLEALSRGAASALPAGGGWQQRDSPCCCSPRWRLPE